MPDLTVVITNHGRHDWLKKCVLSCSRAKVKNLVIASSKITPEVSSQHEKAKELFPKCKILTWKNDPGNNRAWMSGVEAAPTDWVMILHDDDEVLPEFSEVMELDVPPAAKFIMWDGTMVDPGNYRNSFEVRTDFGTGLVPVWRLARQAFSRQFLTFSPVAGCFPKKGLLESLKTAGSHLKDPSFFVRPTMLVGNDLWIWLDAIRRGGEFYYIKQPLNLYAGHMGSISYRAHVEKNGELLSQYNGVRDIFEKKYRM